MKSMAPRKRIKKFRLDKVIGEGSFGRVFLAFDETNGLPIAVKQVPITTFGNDNKL